MNKQPVYYMQTDPRWKDKPYRVTGENATVGGSGCGPSCAAMLIETLTGKTFTPLDACNWSMEHGYKALNQGTYYSYFTPQFKEYGIECQMLNWVNTYGKPAHSNHTKAFEMLKQGYYLIALMGKGLWTSSGHFVVVWWEDGQVRINDPASTKDYRLNGDLYSFKSQVKYYWWVDARAYNSGTEQEEEEMTQEQFNKMMDNYLAAQAKADPDSWSSEARQWAERNGIVAGTPDGSKQYKKFTTKEEITQMLYALSKNISY